MKQNYYKNEASLRNHISVVLEQVKMTQNYYKNEASLHNHISVVLEQVKKKRICNVKEVFDLFGIDQPVPDQCKQYLKKYKALCSYCAQNIFAFINRDTITKIPPDNRCGVGVIPVYIFIGRPYYELEQDAVRCNRTTFIKNNICYEHFCRPCHHLYVTTLSWSRKIIMKKYKNYVTNDIINIILQYMKPIRVCLSHSDIESHRSVLKKIHYFYTDTCEPIIYEFNNEMQYREKLLEENGEILKSPKLFYGLCPVTRKHL